jgi:uncharacterized membrane protein YkoI
MCRSGAAGSGFGVSFRDHSGTERYPGGKIIEGALMARIALSSLVLLAGLVFLLPAQAAVGREQAASLAQRETPGRVLAVERRLYVDNTTVVWRIKVLTAAGEVRLVVIDAETGRFR